MKTVPFSITVDPIGGHLEVDGQDVTDRVEAFQLQVSDHEPSLLTLHHAPGTGPIEGEAIIRLVDHDQTPVDLIRSFLDAVDAGALEKRVAELSDWGTETGVLFLQALRELLA